MCELVLNESSYWNHPVTDTSTSSSFSDKSWLTVFKSTMPSSGKINDKIYTIPPQQLLFCDYDSQSVQPQSNFDTSSYGIGIIKSIDHEDFNTNLIVKLPPKRRRRVVFKVLNRRKGKPSLVDDSDLLIDI